MNTEQIDTTVSWSVDDMILNAREWIGMVAADGSKAQAAELAITESMRMLAGQIRYEKDGSRIEVTP